MLKEISMWGNQAYKIKRIIINEVQWWINKNSGEMKKWSIKFNMSSYS